MKRIIGRVLIVLPAVLLQILWYVLVVLVLNKFMGGNLGIVLRAVFTVLAIIFVIYLVSKRDESSYKILWIIVILALPILGAMLYLTLGNKKTGKKLTEKLQKAKKNLLEDNEKAEKGRSQNQIILDKIKSEEPRLGQSLQHLSESTYFPVHINGTSKYYPFGEDMFADMVEDLKKAEHYVYIEYFIIENGKFWDTLVDILQDKASEGVDVRVMYDDLGSIGTYSVKDIADLQKKGIRCISFNPFLLIKSQLNNRDHRKIMVIDGKVAYSGGVNLADEYINEVEKFGVWKDIGFRITGTAVQSYTYMFAEFWDAFSKDPVPKKMLVKSGYDEAPDETNGYILPYYDSPMRDEPASNVLFTEFLSMATDYVWFYTPYLMLGDALFDAFIRAAKRGVDVRIIMPGIPDKKMVFRLGRSYYKDLLAAGVKIYEYEPGFVHAKAVLMDGKICGIGTVNLDYRSLFLHFECYSLFYKADIYESLKKDYLETLKKCRVMSIEDVQKGRLGMLWDGILRIAAPLL